MAARMTSSDRSDIPFESLFRKHGSIMLLLDSKSRQIIDANDAALRFYGYTIQQITSLKIDAINKLPSEILAAEQQKAIKGEQKSVIRSHHLPNGECRTVEIHTTSIMIENQECLFSVIHDITESKEEEQKLRISEISLKKAQKVAHLGNWVWHVKTNSLEWSDEMYHIFGIDKKTFSKVDTPVWNLHNGSR
jgi:PAS domain S-box-containing protein